MVVPRVYGRLVGIVGLGSVVLAGCQFDAVGTGMGGTAAGATGSSGPAVNAGDTSDTTDGRGTSSNSSTSTTTSTTGEGGETSTGTTGESGSPPPVLLPDCAAILEDDPAAQSGVFVIDPDGVSGGGIEVYCDMDTDGGGWTRFWWWTPGTWPGEVLDVLQSPFGECEAEAAYCFSRLPPLQEDATSLLAIDPLTPTKYRWDFDPANSTAHAAWLAFAQHMPIADGVARDGDEWAPVELEGSLPPTGTQDSFMYRTEHGVTSILMDDDNCDDQTTLQMGHGMCYGGWGTGSSAEFSYGVDRLRDPGPETGPLPDFHLELFYR